MLIDSHCHLDDYIDLPAVLARAHAADVGQLLAVGIGDGPHEMHRALELAQIHQGAEHAPRIFASAGVHPQEAHHATPEALEKLRILAADPLCVAIGEIGLDYYHADNPEIEVQQAAFIAQMRIAAEVRKPILIHCRTSELARPDAKEKFGAADPEAAWDDLLRLIAEHWTSTVQGSSLPGIMHCFSGNEDQARRSLQAGFYLSFAGNLTYPKSTSIQHVAASAPADRILIETDAPFLTPVPLRGQRNEPAHIAHTATFLAELRGVYAADIARQTTRNFHTLFPTTAP